MLDEDLWLRQQPSSQHNGMTCVLCAALMMSERPPRCSALPCAALFFFFFFFFFLFFFFFVFFVFFFAFLYFFSASSFSDSGHRGSIVAGSCHAHSCSKNSEGFVLHRRLTLRRRIIWWMYQRE